MKKCFFIPLFFVLLGCGEHSLENFSNVLGDYLKSSSSSESDILRGLVPNSIIPDGIRHDIEEKMPINEGTTPPDISGKYVASRLEIVSSSIANDPMMERNFADLYIAFTEKAGKIYYRSKQKDATGNSDSLAVDVVGKGDDFTAYFIEVGQTKGISTKMSTVISGTITDNGIKNFSYSFIMVEKGPDPDNQLVPVKTYRVFRDEDGLAERYDWSY